MLAKKVVYPTPEFLTTISLKPLSVEEFKKEAKKKNLRFAEGSVLQIMETDGYEDTSSLCSGELDLYTVSWGEICGSYDRTELFERAGNMELSGYLPLQVGPLLALQCDDHACDRDLFVAHEPIKLNENHRARSNFALQPEKETYRLGVEIAPFQPDTMWIFAKIKEDKETFSLV